MGVTEVYQVEHETIAEIANDFGLDVESSIGLPGDQWSYRVYKGANQIFCGTEGTVRKFLVQYRRDRPGLFSEGLYGAKE